MQKFYIKPPADFTIYSLFKSVLNTLGNYSSFIIASQWRLCTYAKLSLSSCCPRGDYSYPFFHSLVCFQVVAPLRSTNTSVIMKHGHGVRKLLLDWMDVM